MNLNEFSAIVRAAKERHRGTHEKVKVAQVFSYKQKEIAPAGQSAEAGRIRIVIGMTGMDGRDEPVRSLSAAIRGSGMELIFAGSKLSPVALARIAAEEDADVVAVGCPSGAHMHFVQELMSLRHGQSPAPRWKFVLGGIIPDRDVARLHDLGVDLVIPGYGVPDREIAERIRAIAPKHLFRHC